MRILHMIWSMSGGGAERQLAYLAPRMAQHGHDVHVAFAYGGVHAERLRASGVALHELPLSPKALLLPRAVPRIQRLRPHVVHTWLAYTDLLGFAATRLLRLPWVMSERSAALSYPPVPLNRLRAAAGRRADRIVANSPGGAEYWREQGADPARIEIVPNYVLSDEIDAAEPIDDARLRSGDELVVHVGRLSFEKNLPALVDALQRVCLARPRARVAFCGDGPLRPELEARVRALRIEERVIFTGFVANAVSWLKRASAAVTVSPCEGHPNALLEAVAAGVPVIVSDIAAHRSLLAADAAAFVPAGDVEAIAAAVTATLDERDAALARAARARRGLAPLSLDDAAARYEEIYRAAIARRGKR